MLLEGLVIVSACSSATARGRLRNDGLGSSRGTGVCHETIAKLLRWFESTDTCVELHLLIDEICILLYSNILIYIQQDETLHSLCYLETALHVLGGTTIHHQERKQLYLQHLVFVTLYWIELNVFLC